MPMIRKALQNREQRIDAVPPFQGVQPLTSDAILQAMYPGDPRLGLPNQIIVNENSAITIPAASRAIQIIAGTIAGASKDVVSLNTGKPASRVGQASIIWNPHPLFDEFSWWEHAMLNLLLRGDSMSYIEREGGVGPIKSLTPLDPRSFDVKGVYSKSNPNVLIDVIYCGTVQGQYVALDRSQIFHIPGMSLDGLRGVSVISYGARALSVAIGSDTAARDFFTNGNLMSGILTTDKRLEEKQAEALKQRWRKKTAGLNNAHDIVVMDQGASFQPVSMSMQDAQFLQSRAFNIQEIGRLFGVPPHLLGDVSEKPQTVEEVSLGFQLFTLNQWTARIAAAVTKFLLPNSLGMRWHMENLTKPDMRTRSAAALMWRQVGVKSIDELRAEEQLPPLGTPESQDPMYLVGAAPIVGAAKPAENTGKPEQPVPSDKPQDPSEDPNK